MSVTLGECNRFGCPVDGQRLRQVVGVDRDDPADGFERRGFGSDAVDAAAEDGNIDVPADGLRAVDALGDGQIERLPVMFRDDQYPAHNNPLFLSS